MDIGLYEDSSSGKKDIAMLIQEVILFSLNSAGGLYGGDSLIKSTRDFEGSLK